MKSKAEKGRLRQVGKQMSSDSYWDRMKECRRGPIGIFCSSQAFPNIADKGKEPQDPPGLALPNALTLTPPSDELGCSLERVKKEDSLSHLQDTIHHPPQPTAAGTVLSTSLQYS